MSKLQWDQVAERLCETGIEKVAVYVLRHGSYSSGVAWNGVVSVEESASGGEATSFYADNIKYLNLVSQEDLTLTIEAYSYPREFQVCIGKSEPVDGVILDQQSRNAFGLVYQTKIVDSTGDDSYGVLIHLVYSGMSGAAKAAYSSTGESVDPSTRSFEITTSPVLVDGHKPTHEIVINSTEFRDNGLMNIFRKIVDILYGCDDGAPTMILPNDFLAIVEREQYIEDSLGEYILDSSNQPLEGYAII